MPPPAQTPGVGRRRAERSAQLGQRRELTAANLAQQRQQPYQARMPSASKGAAGRNDGALPWVGRGLGAVCQLCGMPGHDADVCADRPAPKPVRLSIDVEASRTSLEGEPSFSDIPDSPSAMFPKPTAAEIARRVRREKTEEAEEAVKREEAMANAAARVRREEDEEATRRKTEEPAAPDGDEQTPPRGGQADVADTPRSAVPDGDERTPPRGGDADVADAPRPVASAPTPLALRRPPPLPLPDASEDDDDDDSITDGLAGFAAAKAAAAAREDEMPPRGRHAGKAGEGSGGRPVANLAAVDAALRAADAAVAASEARRAATAASTRGDTRHLEETQPTLEALLATPPPPGVASTKPKPRQRPITEGSAFAPGDERTGVSQVSENVAAHSAPRSISGGSGSSAAGPAVSGREGEEKTRGEEHSFPEGGVEAFREALRAAEAESAALRRELAAAKAAASAARSVTSAQAEQHRIQLAAAQSSAAEARGAAAEARAREAAALAALEDLRSASKRAGVDRGAREDALRAAREAAEAEAATCRAEAAAARIDAEDTRRRLDRATASFEEDAAALRRRLSIAELASHRAAGAAHEELEGVRRELTAARAEEEAARGRASAAEARITAAEEKTAAAEARARTAEASERRLMALRRKAAREAERRGEAETEAHAARRARDRLARATPTTNQKEGDADALASARGDALATAKADVERERAEAARAEAEARRAWEKAAEAEAASAAAAAGRAPAHLRALHLASRAFVCAGEEEKNINAGGNTPSGSSAARDVASRLAALGYETTVRPSGALAAPARAKDAAALVLIPSEATRDDPGCALEVAAAVTARRRVLVLVDRRPRDAAGHEPAEHEPSPGVPWGLLPEEACALEPAPEVVTHAAEDADEAPANLARALGASDAFLATLPPSALAALRGKCEHASRETDAGATGATTPDLVGLAGVTSLSLPASWTAPGGCDGIAEALAGVLTRATCTLRTLALPGCSPAAAGEVAAAALAPRAKLASLSFGGVALPMDAIRCAAAGVAELAELNLAGGQNEHASAASSSSDASASVGVGAAELAALAATLGGRSKIGRSVTSLRLPPRCPAVTTRKIVDAIGCASPPSINAVPSVVAASVSTVDLAGAPGCGVPGMCALAGALASLGPAGASCLRALCLGGTALGAEGGEMLAEVLASPACEGLERLLVPGAGLGPRGVEAVCAALPKGLLVLDLAGNAGGDRAGKAAGEALRRCGSLRRLGVAANDVGADGARGLAPAVRDHAALEELRLAGNRVGDRGAAALAVATSTTKAPLRVLDVGENHNVTGAGARAVAGAIAASTTLSEVNLCKATIGSEGAKALGAALAETRTLRSLELSGCKLRAEGAKLIAGGLRGNATLVRLGLARNSLGDKGVFELCAGGLEACKGLRELDLRHNAIGPAGAKALTAALEKKNFTLSAIAFAGNKTGPDEEAALVALAASARRRPAPRFKAPALPEESIHKGADVGDEKENVAKDGAALFDAFVPP